jgi:hypothetical protein
MADGYLRGVTIIGITADQQLEEILRRLDELPVLDFRTPDEILGYDQDGLPQ